MKFPGILLFTTALFLLFPSYILSQQDEQIPSSPVLKAAENGSPVAQFSLGMAYIQGNGVSQNYEEAEKWFRKAAEQGNTSAQCMLGAIYATGLGVPKDYIQAYKWLSLSIEGSKGTEAPYLKKATELSNTIIKKMTPQQIEEAQNLASKWKPVRLSIPKQIGGNVLRSRLIKKVEPVYPDIAKRKRIQGLVILVVTVDEEGNVADIRVTRGQPELTGAAVEAVKQWKYSPTVLEGKPIPVTATVTVNFVLGR